MHCIDLVLFTPFARYTKRVKKRSHIRRTGKQTKTIALCLSCPIPCSRSSTTHLWGTRKCTPGSPSPPPPLADAADRPPAEFRESHSYRDCGTSGPMCPDTGPAAWTAAGRRLPLRAAPSAPRPPPQPPAGSPWRLRRWRSMRVPRGRRSCGSFFPTALVVARDECT